MKKCLFLVSSAVLLLASGMQAFAANELPEKVTATALTSHRAVTEAPANPVNKPIVQQIRKKAPEQSQRLYRSIKGNLTPVYPQKATGKSARKAAADIPAMRGMVVYNDNYVYSEHAGLYNLSEDGHTMFLKGPYGHGGIEVDGVYYVHTYGEFMWGGMYGSVTGYDLQTSQTSYSSMDTSPIQGAVAGLAKDPTNGLVYAITYNNTGEKLQLTQFQYGRYLSSSKLADIDASYNYNSIACDRDGQLYVITFKTEGSGDSYSVVSSSLCKLDKETGAVTEIGETGHLPYGASGAAIDPATNRMFWTVYTAEGKGYLCEVDLTSGEASKLYDFANNDEITGLCFPEPIAPAGAPAKPENFKIDFPRGSLSGTISFKVPSTNYDGTPGEGNVNYFFTFDYKQITGTAAYGEEVTIDASVTYHSSFFIEGYLFNDAGKSPKVFDRVFIGRGVPNTPAVNVSREGSKVDVSWAPVTDSSDGGFIDPDSVIYTVRRYINEQPEVIADSITATAITDEFADSDDPTTVYYTVQAFASFKKSAEGRSESIITGSITPPYSNDFATAGHFGGYTVFDVKGDGKGWELYGSYSSVKVRCNYSYSNPKDDWLFTPPVNLKAGKAYRFGFATNGSSSYTAETIEVRWGSTPSVEGMTGEVIPPTTVKSTKKVELSSIVIPETDGQYYFGIHAMSARTSYYLYADDIVIEEVDCTLLPGVATDLKVTPDPTGALTAEISFKAPTLNMEGTALETLDHIILKRNGVPIDTIMTSEPGAALSITDVVPSAGYYDYAVQAFTETGGGRDVSATAFVGVNRPAAPANVVMEETSTPGEVRFAWDAVDTDVDGAPLNADLVSYAICVPVDLGFAIYYQPVYDDIKDTEFIVQAAEPGTQKFIEYIVCAKTTGGLSQGVQTPLLAVGTPYEEIHESFTDGYVKYAFYTSGNEDSQWIPATEATLNGFPSQDNDNGFLYMAVNYIDYYAELTTAKVKLPSDHAAIQLYTYKFAPMPGYDEIRNTIEIFVRELGQTEFTRVGNPFVICDLPVEEGWVALGASLDEYAGKTVQLKIRGTAINDAYNFIDNLRIGRILSKDASVAVNAPAKVSAGEEYSATVTVENKGLESLPGMKVRLFADGDEIGDSFTESLLPGVSESLSFHSAMHPLAERPVALVATVEFDGDEDLANNASSIAAVVPKVSLFPAVTDLEGHADGQGNVALTWSEPDLSNGPAEVTVDDFEDAESFATVYDGWVFVDVDQQPIAGIQGINMPIEIQSLQSFWIHDRNWEEGRVFNDAHNSYSGTKHLASMATYNGTPCDDWAISPALCGQAQDITFRAKSFHPAYTEVLQVYYSTGSTDPKDFTLVLDRTEVPNDWTRYIVELPAGAKRVAIRKCSVNGFMMFVDDFEFAAEGAETNRNLKGYDIYRDATLANESIVAATDWTDMAPAEGNHDYTVVAVFDRGLSRASNVVTVNVETNAIEEVSVESEAEYYNLQGLRVDNPVSGNIYIRRKGSDVSKILLR